MCLFFFNDTATTEIYTLSLHDALPIFRVGREIGEVFHQRVVRAADLTAFAHEQHIAVTAQARVSRPFVARKDDETAVAIVFCGEAGQLLPERGRGLEGVEPPRSEEHTAEL